MNEVDINPLAAARLREVSHIPPHFTISDLSVHIPTEVYRNWIYENLSGRFYLGDRLAESRNHSNIVSIACVAFEDSAENTFFTLSIDSIERSHRDDITGFLV